MQFWRKETRSKCRIGCSNVDLIQSDCWFSAEGL
jgi:hypothetical protein